MGKRIKYGNRLDKGLIRKLIILAVKEGKSKSELLEEAIIGLLHKYEKKTDILKNTPDG